MRALFMPSNRTILTWMDGEERDTRAPSSCHQLALIGIDLLITKNEQGAFDARILEVNNNPAMPSPSKHKMSSHYREHLVAFIGDLIELGMCGGSSSSSGSRFIELHAA